MVITNRLFRAVCYHPDIYQIITSGTDRKVCLGFFFFPPFSLMTQCTDIIAVVISVGVEQKKKKIL